MSTSTSARARRSASARRNRLGAAALAVAALLFLLYPALRPWQDESTLDGATLAMSSNAWVASHVFAMIGFVLVPLGLFALREVVRQTPGAHAAGGALVTTWVGAGLTLPYYGAETFGLHAIASHAAQGQPVDLLGLAEAFRYDPVAVTTFAAGLLLLAAGAILAAVAIRRSGILPRNAGIPFAVGFALFLPQFFTPPAARIGHGILMAVGIGWVALTLARAETRADARDPVAG